MQLEVVNGSSNNVDVSDNIFAREFNQDLVHQVVNAYQAAGRQGTKAQKSRSDVSGGGTKPWRQKGTGRARAGTSRSPLWRKGGVTFAGTNRDFSQKVNRKMYRAAMSAILSELVREERLAVVGGFELAEPKTKLLVSVLNDLSAEGKVLLVIEDEHEALVRAASNLHWVKVVLAHHVDPVSLVDCDKVIFTVEALKKVEEKLA